MAMARSKSVNTDPSSTPPKLSLYSLPSQRPEPAGMATPPLRVPVSVPFAWEEAPGKPRKERGPCDPRPSPRPRWHRGLDLPPRMVAGEMRSSTMSSIPVLDGPYVLGRATSCYSFSLGDENPVKSKESGVWFWRRGRERKVRRYRNWEMNFRGLRGFISPSLSSSSQSSAGSSGGDGIGNEEEEEEEEEEAEAKHDKKVRITRFRRTKSLASASSHATSHLWAGIYGSLKQFVPWRKERAI
ncbi:uncharacterized protein At4g00950 [Phoenix dactylifera]|uniref:Uncharacterized protein At4g00950 n=1 Tax=Phoenix dactylifera TaxID=42345 RepID=A0A8B7CTV8_PHODC|nr:uncharacterized protein At4g00950 [Phoenix dactylifera]